MEKLLHASQRFIKRNASTILTCIGGAGVIATSVMAVKATPKALMMVADAEEEKGESLSKWEVVKAAGPAYIPAIVVGASTIACIFGANALNQRQQASLMSAYALLDNSYKEYKNKLIELYGEEADTRIREGIAKDKYTGDEAPTDNDKVLFYDEFSGRYFHSTVADILRVELEVNKTLSDWGGLYLNDVYDLLDIPRTNYGDHLGWSAAGMYEMYWSQWLDFDTKKFTLDDGLECYILTFGVEPIPGFEEY